MSEPLSLKPDSSAPAPYGTEAPLALPQSAAGSWTLVADLIKKRWGLILALVALSEIGIAAYTLTAPKTYVAYTTLNSGIGSKDPLGGGGDWFSQGTMVANITELIKSRTVLESTLQAMKRGGNVEELARRVTVSRMGAAGLLKLECEASSPDQASDLANTLVREFLRFYSSSQSHEARSNQAFFESQVSRSQERLSQAEERLRAFKGEQVPEMQSDLPARLSALIAQRDETGRNLAASKAGLAVASRELAGLRADPLLREKLSDNQAVVTANDRLRDLQTNLDDARRLYAANSPIVQNLTAQIARARRQLRSTSREVYEAGAGLAPASDRLAALRTEVAMNAARLASLEASIAQLRPLARQASTAKVTYDQLTREVKIAESQYMDLQTKFGQSNLMAQGASILNMSVVDAAIAPREPISSKLVLKLALGLVLSLGLALFVSYLLSLRERGRERLKRARPEFTAQGLNA